MLVTIALPTNNCSNYIEYTLANCYEQNYNDIELIISDDNSSDGSIEIIKQIISQRKFKSRFNKIIFIKNNKSIGVQKNFEKINSKFSGDILVCFNQDDYSTGQRLKNIVDGKHQELYYWGFGSLAFINESGANITDVKKLPKHLVEVAGLVKSKGNLFNFDECLFLLANLCITNGNIFYSKSLKPLVSLLTRLNEYSTWSFALSAAYLSPPRHISSQDVLIRLYSTTKKNDEKLSDLIPTDFLPILVETLYLCNFPKNSNFDTTLNYMEFKNVYESKYSKLNALGYQSDIAHSGINILTNLSLVEKSMSVLSILNELGS